MGLKRVGCIKKSPVPSPVQGLFYFLSEPVSERNIHYTTEVAAASIISISSLPALKMKNLCCDIPSAGLVFLSYLLVLVHFFTILKTISLLMGLDI